MLTLDFLLVNASTSQEPFITELMTLQPPPDNTTLIISTALPASDMEWCCALCCHGNFSEETVFSMMTLTLSLIHI